MSDHTTDLNKETFEAAIKKDGILLIDFWADWCMPCRAFAPVYERAAEKHSDIVFTKVNTQVEQELAGAFGINSIPTLAVFRDGVLLYAEPGALPPQALEKLIETVRALDMNDVKKQIAELEAKNKPGNGATGAETPAPAAAAPAPAAEAKPSESKS